MSYLQTKVVSHAARVRALYKQALRTLQSYHHTRHELRYHAVVMRARFDEHANEVDMVKAKKLLDAGERELFEKAHPQPYKFPNSPGGSAYGREVQMPDWYLDVWHPLERAQYPTYFARREQQKLAYIENWEKKHGKPETEAH